MRRFYLLGVLAVVLAGCGSSSQEQAIFHAKIDAQREQDLIFVIRSAQENYRQYLQSRLDECKAKNQLLTRDQDGILVCVEGPKKTEENK